MVLENVTFYLTNVFNQLSVEGARSTMEPLLIFVVGMVIYSLFIFGFYRFISRRDLFKLNRNSKHSKLRKVAYVLEYLFLFPIVAFLWFLVISILLSILSTVLTIGNIFMISMAILATVRITAYANQELSAEIAKMIPFALLGVLLLDISTFSTIPIFEVVKKLPSTATTLIYYFIFIFIIEIVLKALLHIKHSVRKKDKNPENPKAKV